jgi:L-cysteine:1D-myo-inositol 2-amino-2-deoxy-alpha-D-glucopyranoside ligase
MSSNRPLHLYNSYTQQLEPFSPAGDPVTLYVCGITPYDTTHLGHAFTYSANDILIRYLEYLGYKVRYVQNVTDIDDDILRRASEGGSDWRELGDRWTRHFIRDMQSLNVRPPDEFPRATDVIDAIFDMVQSLLEAGVAYEVAGNVYFDIEAWPEFGKLSRLDPEEMLPIANERGNHPDDPNKRHPLHFVLWQARAPGEPAWDGPWGPGRPGWHIECSTMATRLLGETIDVHSGGADLIFPHHECEIAQVEPITGKHPFVRYWLHTAMVRHEGEKMSKSLGNLVMVRDLLDEWTPDVLRLYLGRHHYRTPWSYDRSRLGRMAQVVEQLTAAASMEGGQGEPLADESEVGAFQQAMNADLDSGQAIEIMQRLAGRILGAHGESLGEAQLELRRMASVLGLCLDGECPEERVRQGWDRHYQRFTAG